MINPPMMILENRIMFISKALCVGVVVLVGALVVAVLAMLKRLGLMVELDHLNKRHAKEAIAVQERKIVQRDQTITAWEEESGYCLTALVEVMKSLEMEFVELPSEKPKEPVTLRQGLGALATYAAKRCKDDSDERRRLKKQVADDAKSLLDKTREIAEAKRATKSAEDALAAIERNVEDSNREVERLRSQAVTLLGERDNLRKCNDEQVEVIEDQKDQMDALRHERQEALDAVLTYKQEDADKDQRLEMLENRMAQALELLNDVSAFAVAMKTFRTKLDSHQGNLNRLKTKLTPPEKGLPGIKFAGTRENAEKIVEAIEEVNPSIDVVGVVTGGEHRGEVVGWGLPDPTLELTPAEWCNYFETEIIDPDGWRGTGYLEEKDFVDRITRYEFAQRWAASTAKQPGNKELNDILKDLAEQEKDTPVE